jgi:hypothetical protein
MLTPVKEAAIKALQQIVERIEAQPLSQRDKAILDRLRTLIEDLQQDTKSGAV